MADVKSVVLNPGKALLTRALTGLQLFEPSYFGVGDNFGYEPLATDTGPSGTLVFTGNRLLVQRKQLSNDTARYILTIPEGEGPFTIGNIVLYAENVDDDIPTPFIEVVLPFAYSKQVADPNLQQALYDGVPLPGNRFVCNINIKHTLEAISVSVSIVTPTFSSLGFYESVAQIPAPTLNPWKTFVAHDDPRVSRPVMVVKRNDDTYWGIPFWQNFRDPMFGVLDGGVAGDNYKPRPANYEWGYTYQTPDVKFSGLLGGSTYETDDADYTDTVGGDSY